MKFKALKVKPDCGWVTQGKTYSARPVNRVPSDDAYFIIDDFGLSTIVFSGDSAHLNDYIEWGIIN